MEILKSNLYEIRKSGSLKTLGGLLALFHVLQFYLWYDQGELPLKYLQQGLPMCRALIENCQFLGLVPVAVVKGLFYAYGSFALLAALVFLLTEFVGFGYLLLLTATVLGFSFYFQDLRLSSNEGYFVFLLSAAFLLIPAKHRTMRWLIVSFFVAHGLAQASPDWLTGNWYMEHLNLPVKLAEWLAALCLLVQMIGGAALLFRDGRYFWSGWSAIFAFEFGHLFMNELQPSSLALGALLYVAFDEIELRKAERQYIYQSFIRPEPSFLMGGILLGCFWVAQLSPLLTLPQTSSAKTFLDMWTLHPEAAHEDCEQKTFAIYKDRTEEIAVESQVARQPALVCNPYMRFIDLKGMCKQLREADNNFVTLSSSLRVRNFREKASFKAFEVQDFCNPELTFKRISEVEWNTNRER